MNGWRIFLWAALVVGSLFFLYLVRGILLPFIVSFILAALLEPTVRKLRLKGMSRKGAVSLVMVLFISVVAGGAILITPTVSREGKILSDKVQELTATLSKTNENDNFFLRWNPTYQIQQNANPSQIDRLLSENREALERVGLPTTRREFMEQYVDKNRPQIAKILQNFSNSLFGVITNAFSQLMFVVIVPILVPLILLEMEDIKRRTPRWIPPSIRDSMISVLGDIGQVFFKYLRGISTVVLLYTASITFLLAITGVPSWVLLGPLFGALYLIPYLGNIMSAVTVFSVVGFSGVTGGMFHPFASSWAYAALVTVLYLVVAFSFDHMIYPQMVGNSVGLSPVVSMFVIFCGGALFGVVGMLIAFPLAGSVKVILDRLLRFTSSTQDGLHLPSVPLRHRASS